MAGDPVHQLLGDMKCFGETQNENQINGDWAWGEMFLQITLNCAVKFSVFSFSTFYYVPICLWFSPPDVKSSNFLSTKFEF